jgi:DNA-binding beta-propeller fold protein YncE
MSAKGRRALIALALAAATAAQAGCGHIGDGASSAGAVTAKLTPERILNAPKGLLAVAEPQASGTLWALAGTSSVGLFRLSTAAAGRPSGSVSVSSAARSVAETSGGVLGLALGARQSGALELRDARTGKLIRSVALPAPARQVVADGSDFYVLTAWSGSASVAVVSARSGTIRHSVPMPADAVSIAPDTAQGSIYALEQTGLVDEIAVSDGKIVAKFKAGDDGEAIALGPDGGTLYVLKGTPQVSNIAEVQVSTESVRRVLPAPSHCNGLLVLASGRQLYEVVGTPGYGNIQVFAL